LQKARTADNITDSRWISIKPACFVKSQSKPKTPEAKGFSYRVEKPEDAIGKKLQ